MTDENKNNKSKRGSGLAAGIAIGAAIGAAAVALKDKKNQQKVKDTVGKVKKWADHTSEKVIDRSDEMIKEAQKDMESIRKEIKEPKN